MRKWMIGIVLIALLVLVSPAVQAETYVLDELMATVDIPDTYIVITPDNIASYAEWLAGQDVSSEETVNDMLRRGVLLQAWDQEEPSRRFELVATKSEQTELIFDVNEQTNDLRRTYRTSFYPKNEYTTEGYTFSTSNWKHADNGRFLILEYIMRQYGEIDHRGYMRRTIRNGYEITLDMQVYGRRPVTKDNTALNKIWNTFTFIEILPLPAIASAQINITSTPPKETNETNVSIEGTAAEGVTFKAVMMGLNYNGKLDAEVTVGSSGKFTIPFEIPKEGVYTITVSAEYNEEIVAELLYSVIYSRTLLAVNVTSDIPDIVTADSITIQGTAEPRAEIQIFVNSEKIDVKKVTAEGRFSIEIDTTDEGLYDVRLAFSKKDLADRSYRVKFTRSWTTEDMINRIKSDSVSPNYSKLTESNERYDGRTINYKCYLVEVLESGDDWIYKMALNKSGDSYSNFILVIAQEEPVYDIGTRLMMYGTSVGMSVPSEEDQGAEGKASTGESYPCFDLLMLTTL